MTPTDFLTERQPTQTTAIILGTLQSFLKGTPLETGFAFENELKACKLDYTLASLQRIDDFLDNIRTTHSLDRNDFLNGGVPSNHTFCFYWHFIVVKCVGDWQKLPPFGMTMRNTSPKIQRCKAFSPT